MPANQDGPWKPKNIISVTTSDICREPQMWHVRLHFSDSEVARAARLIQESGEIEPIRVCEGGERLYRIVSGAIHLRAAESIGYSNIPAYVVSNADPLDLLQIALIAEGPKLQPTTLENAWAIARLFRARQEMNPGYTQAKLSLDLGSDAGKISHALKIADRLPEEVACRTAEHFEIPLGAIVTLSRDATRAIARARSSEELDFLLATACEKIKDGRNPTSTLKRLAPPTVSRKRAPSAAQPVLPARAAHFERRRDENRLRAPRAIGRKSIRGIKRCRLGRKGINPISDGLKSEVAKFRDARLPPMNLVRKILLLTLRAATRLRTRSIRLYCYFSERLFSPALGAIRYRRGEAAHMKGRLTSDSLQNSDDLRGGDGAAGPRF